MKSSFLPTFCGLSCFALGLSGLAGCGIGVVDRSATVSLALHGTVHGGQQPVSNSAVHLFAAGNTGNRSQSKDLLSVGSGSNQAAYVLTGADGSFDITGDYHCVNSNDQMYIAAEQGDAGLGNPNNAALVMITALGPCSGLSSISNIWIDEVTTAAAAWAFAPFAASVDHIGSTSTNTTGIGNAFLDAQLLASISTGLPTVLPSTQVIETGKLYALANALSGCVNSSGGAACSPLFTAAKPPGGSMPGDTFTAALDIVQFPGANPGGVYYAIPTQTPYPALLSQPPSDWTMSLTLNGNGLYQPTALALDASGNVWVADYVGGVSGFTSQGTPIAGSPFGTGTPASGDSAPNGEGHGPLNEVFGLAVGTNGNIWATNEEFSSTATSNVVALYGASSGKTAGTQLGQFGSDQLAFPESMTADRFGHIITGNYNRGDATAYNADGSIFKSGIGDETSNGLTGGDASYPIAVAADGLGGTWISDNDLTVTHVDASGDLMRPTCCDDVDGLAADAQGNGWISNYYGGTVSVVSPGSIVNGNYVAGTLLARISGGGLTYPAGIAVDSVQNVWVANYHGQSFSELSYSTATKTGSALSPTTGYGLDAGMSLPFSISPDPSGNLWISDYGNGTVTMFFGIASPTATPNTTPQVAP